MVALLLAAGARHGHVARRHEAAHRLADRPPGRPADPRGRARRAHREGGHARPWAASPSSAPRVVGYVVAHVRSGVVFTRTGLLVMACIVGAGVVGPARRLDQGPRRAQPRPDEAGQDRSACSPWPIGFAVLAVLWTDVHTTLSFTRFDCPGLELGTPVWCVWAVLLIFATTNGVNLTDGLDGLAAGSSIFAFIAFMVIGFWAFRHPDIYQVEPRARPRRGRRRDAGRLRRVPLVERRAGADLHGRHRLARHRRRPRRARRSRSTRTCCCRSSAALFVRRDAVGDPPGGQLPASSSAASSAWRRSTTTSSWRAGPRPR